MARDNSRSCQGLKRSNLSEKETERDKTMRKEISIREYRPNDIQALANIYFNTIHKINIQHYTEEQVNVWAPKSSVENTEDGQKNSREPNQSLLLSEMISLDLLSLSQTVILTVSIVIMSGLGKALDQLL
jgi:hypothetical protein